MMSKQVRDGISQTDYVTLSQTCDQTGLSAKVIGVRMEGSFKAIVRWEAAAPELRAFGEVTKTMFYEDGKWDLAPTPEFAAELGEPVAEVIAQEKAAGRCEKDSSVAVTPTSSPQLPTNTSAAPAAMHVIYVGAVVDGQPANGYTEGAALSHVNDVFDCMASPAWEHLGDAPVDSADSNIYSCAPSAAHADVCWPSTPGTLLCVDNPWDKGLYRVTYTDPLPTVQLPTAPVPFALLLDDGTQCRLRNGGNWGLRDDGLAGVYGCPDENFVVLGSSDSPTIDRSQPLWTVKVGPLPPATSSVTHFPPPEIHTVTTAWFARD